MPWVRQWVAGPPSSWCSEPLLEEEACVLGLWFPVTARVLTASYVFLLGTQFLLSQVRESKQRTEGWACGRYTMLHANSCVTSVSCLRVYLCMYVFLGRVSIAVTIISKGVSWSPNGKKLHWLNSAVLSISRILYFCGYNAFQIGLGSQLKYCLRVFPQWELCHHWFFLCTKQINGILFLETGGPHIAMIKGLSTRTGGTPAVENTGPSPVGRAQEGKENGPIGGQGSLWSKGDSHDNKRRFRPSCLRLIKNRMGDKGLGK